MKVLINLCPPYQIGTIPSLGLGYLKAILKQRNHEILINDINSSVFLNNKELFEKLLQECKQYLSRNKFLIYTYNLKKLLTLLYHEFFPREKNNLIKDINSEADLQVKKILTKKPDIICFSVFLTNIYFSSILAKKLRKNSEVNIIFGGPLCTEENANIFLKLGICDYVIRGEGEISFQKLIETIEKNQTTDNLSSVSYIQNNKIVHSHDSKLINKLDELPMPEFGDKEYEIIPITSSRGCIKNCSFCAETNQWQYYRRRKADDVVEEMKKRIKENKTKNFFFCDSLLNSSNNWLEEFCEKIISLKVEWSGFLRCEKLDKKLIQKMKESGCKEVAFGIENFNQEILDSIKKETKTRDMIKILKEMYKQKINFIINLIIGYPGETQKLFFRNLEYLIKIFNDIKGFFYINSEFFKIYPGSNIMNNSKEYGIFLNSNKEKLPEELSFLQEDYNNFFTKWINKGKPNPEEFYERVKFMELLSLGTNRRTYSKKKFIIIDNKNIVDLSKIVNKLEKNKKYLFEFKIEGNLLNENTGEKIIEFFDKARYKGIDYDINKTLPSCIFNKKNINFQKSCTDCKEVFIKNKQEISLCSRKMKQILKINNVPKSKHFNENSFIHKCKNCYNCVYRTKGECNYIYC